MKKLLYISIIMLTLVACEEEVRWDLKDHITPRLVVDGIVTNSSDLNYVRLSLPVKDPNSEPEPISNATVIIATSQGNINLIETAERPGEYRTETPLVGVTGVYYRLYVNLGGNEFLSDPVWINPVSPQKEFRSYELSGRPGFYAINPREEDDPSFTRYEVEYKDPETRTHS